MSPEKAKPILARQTTSDKSVKRQQLFRNLPVPLMKLYKDLAISSELGEPLSLFGILQTASAFLKHIALRCISDYWNYYNEKKWSSQEINRSILDYFKTPGDESAYNLVSVILHGLETNELASSIENFSLLFERSEQAESLPEFVDAHSSPMDLFLSFFRLKTELTSGEFAIKRYPGNFEAEYFNILEFLLARVSPVFDSEFNTAPFVSKDEKSGNLLYLHRISEESIFYMDYSSLAEISSENTGKDCASAASDMAKKLRSDSPRDKREIPFPIINFNRFIDFCTRNQVTRNNIRKDIEEFIIKGNRQYGIITGGNGSGKTVILADFVREKRDNPIIFHFIRSRNQNRKPEEALRSLTAQALKLLGRLDTDWRSIPYEPDPLREMFLQKFSEAAAYYKKKNEKLLLVFDGIDETSAREFFAILPENLPDNSIALISMTTDKKHVSAILPDLPTESLFEFRSCPLQGFTREETIQFLKNTISLPEDQKLREKLTGNIFELSEKGSPLKVRMIADSINAGAIDAAGFSLNAPGDGKGSFEPDEFDRNLLRKGIYLPLLSAIQDDAVMTLCLDIAGISLLIQHPLDDERLASMFGTDSTAVSRARRYLNRYLFFEGTDYYIHHENFTRVFEKFYTNKDLTGYHKKIISFYEQGKTGASSPIPDSKALTLDALTYLPYHYYQIGKLTNDYSGLFQLAGNDQFRLEQGLRLNVKAMLDTIYLAVQAAVTTNDIKSLIKFGFLLDDVRSGGIKGGLSMIVSQAMEGNFEEALEMVRKIQDDSFKYKQLLILVWLAAKNNEFLKAMEILDEALYMQGAGFSEEDEDLIFSVVEAAIGLGIAEGLDIIKTGVEEERVVNYYSKLAGLLSGYPDLILKLATGASMQLRKTGDEKLKSRFLLEFARIITYLDDEIKKRQFFEGFVYEAKNLEDEQIRYRTVPELAQIFSGIDMERSEDIMKEVLAELKDAGMAPVERFRLEAHIAGQIARLGKNQWASDLFAGLIETASQLMLAADKAAVFAEIASSLVFLEDPNERADLLEVIFSRSEDFENIEQQAKVMSSISEVLSDSDEDEDLLNIYLETFKYIDELPVDIAAKTVNRIAGNMKIMREEQWYEQVMVVVSNLISYLKTPEEKASTLTPVGEGLCRTKFLPDETKFAYIQGFIDLTSEISGSGSEILLAGTLGATASCLIEQQLNGKEELIRQIIQKAHDIGDEKASLTVYEMIGENLYKLKDDAVIEHIEDHLETVIRECKNTKPVARALIGLTRGVARIDDRLLRERLINKVIYIAENFEEKMQSYRVLSAIAGSLLKAGDDERGTEIYKKALSLIPLKEEKAPDALGGVMAGLCRGMAPYSSKDWARNIYDRLLNRLDFIAPEKKKIEVFLGIADGLRNLQDKNLLRDYYSKLIAFVERFINRREKVLGFRRLARGFKEINDLQLSRRMWERCISIATSLDDEKSWELKTDILSEALVTIWDLEDAAWQAQAAQQIYDSLKGLSVRYLPEFIGKTYSGIQNIKYAESQTNVIENTCTIIENQEDTNDTIKCISSISSGISGLPKGPLLKQILDRTVKIINKLKQGSTKVQAMAIISSNFLKVGIRDWAVQAYASIDKAYKKLKDQNLKATLFSEMFRIPFHSSEAKWQDEVTNLAFETELPQLGNSEKARVLKTMAEILPHSKRKEWTHEQIGKAMKEFKNLDRDSVNEIYHALFKGFADVGDVESIFEYREKLPHQKIVEISSQYLRDTLLHSMQTDIKKSFEYYGRIEDKALKSELLPELFEILMTHRKEFETPEFREHYHNMLLLSVENRDSLDFAIGRLVSFLNDEDMLKSIADTLGLLEKKKPRMTPSGPVAPGEAAIPEVLDIALEQEMGEEAVSAEGELDASGKKSLFRSRSAAKKPKPKLTLGEIPESGEISDFLKDGYVLIREQYFSDAIKYFEKAIEMYPEDPRGFIGMAVIHYMLKDYRQAARLYAQARAANPKYDNMERFLKGVPRNAYIWYDLAKNLYQIGEYDEAIKFAEKIKAEGVYFDFAQKVDELKELCNDGKTGKIKKPVKKKEKSKTGFYAAAAAIIIILLHSGIAWFNYAAGMMNLDDAKTRIRGYEAGKTSGQGSEYQYYSKPFKQASENFNNTFFSLAFPPGMVRDSKIKSSACLYETGHFLIAYQIYRINPPPEMADIKDALKSRQDAVRELDRILLEDPTNYRAFYYKGLCHLDAAMDDRSRALSNSDRNSDFQRAIEFLEKSHGYAAGKKDDLNIPLMLAIARTEAFLAYRGGATTDLLNKAMAELQEAHSYSDDPRSYVYEIAVNKLLRNNNDAKISYGLADEKIKTQYSDRANLKEYWLQKAKQFSNL
ncbi:MAG: tetratricopeptide repeat protein [Firmicutes bacterium]|nr:tetratricopeptide repeat protein [Bacillota bacterium]